MKSVQIGNGQFRIKDYYCSENDSYNAKDDGKLWLYVNLTDVCPAACPFCVNPGRKSGKTGFDTVRFCDTLKKIQPYIYGVSFTGGEPMLAPDLLDRAISVTADIVGSEVEIDMVTNGINLGQIPHLAAAARLDSVHLSRHRISDEKNRKLMGFPAPGQEEIRKVITGLDDPAKLVLNCVLARDGICSREKAADYLEMAAGLGVSNTSFIAMIPVNSYCLEQYVNPASFNLEADSRFRIWNHFHDHEYCSCSSGDYRAGDRWVRFYYRSPGCKKAPYARQLVYTADNRLLAGFGGEEV